MDNYGTTVTGIQYMANVLKLVLRTSFMTKVTNRDFYTPGNNDPKSTRSIKNKYQKYVITSLHSNGWNDYDGNDLTFNKVKEIVSTLTIDTFKSLSDTIDSLAVFKSSVTDPKSAVITSAGGKLQAILDKAVLSFYGDAGAGNWLGTSYTTGTVAIAVNGNVTGSGTTFTAAMVGRPFKAEGHSKWYRVKTYTSATAIVIENDSDDQASSYDGGVISSGTSYEIQAVTKLAITKSNIADQIAKLSQLLDEAHGDDDELQVPPSGRFLLLPAVAKSALLTAAEFNPGGIEKVYGDVTERGMVAKAYGFDIYIAPTNWFHGDNTNGLYCVAGHTSWLTAGFGFIEPVNVIPSKDNQTNYGDKIKGLFGFGFKVADGRRMCGATLFATFA